MWQTLDITPTMDRSEIRRAYARRLKVTNPEDDPAGFQRLRAAYEAALRYADGHIAFEPYDERGNDSPPAPEDIIEAWPDAMPAPRPQVARVPSIPSPDLSDAYAASCRRLENSLAAESSAGDDELLEALQAVLNSPELEIIARRQLAEIWLSQLIVDTQPRSDILTMPVIKYFGWTPKEIQHSRHSSTEHNLRQRILHRQNKVAFLFAVRNPNHDDHAAFQLLNQPPQRETLHDRVFPPIRHKDIAALLERVRRSDPVIATHLNADTVAMWEQRLARPRFSAFDLWAAIAAAIVLPLIIASWFRLPPAGGASVTVLLCFPVIWTGIRLVLVYALSRARWWWRQTPRPAVLAYGWSPAIIALLLSAALPPSALLTWLILIASVFVAWWAFVAGEADRSESNWPVSVRVILAEWFVAAWWLAALWQMPAAAARQMTPVVLAIIVVSAFGRVPLLRLWQKVSLAQQRAGLVAAALVSLAAIAGLWLGYPYESLRALCFGGGALAILLHRVPLLASKDWATSVRRVSINLGLFMTLSHGTPKSMLAVAGTLLLGWAALNCVVAVTAGTTVRES